MDSSSSQRKPNIDQDLRSAMPGEMKSWFEYKAFAEQAEQSGHHELAQVWRAISHVERYDHFYHEAELHGYSKQSIADNVGTALDLAKHHHDQYSRAAQHASAANCTQVADFFNQAAQDAQRNHHLLQQAQGSLQGNGQIPSGPKVNGTKIQKCQPACQGKPQNDLKDALKSSGFAFGLDWILARRAVSEGHPDLGALFLDLAQVEGDHFARAANLFGLVQDDEHNLRESIHGETMAHQQYSRDLSQAQQVGDSAAAKFFQDAAGDEEHHKKDFETFLHRLTKKAAA